MASILKVGDGWRAQIRRKGHKSIAETFPTKARAVIWAREIEAEMDALKFKDVRGLANVTLKTLINRYTEEIGAEHPFGKNKTAVLSNWVKNHGDKALSELTDDYLTDFVRNRRKGGASGVTIAIDLTYLAGIFKTAKELWKIPISLEPIRTARANMAHLKISTRSIERTRRPTNAEITALQDYLDKKSALPMRDIIDFAIESAMRIDEITSLRWADLNEKDRTIIIRDRKHPRQKIGNDQEVPLLGKTFGIIKRQAKPSTPDADDRIFPVVTRTISTIFPRATTALKIVDLHFHDLRHEGVSRLFEQGYRIEQVALISGHRDWKMLARYTQIKAKDLHRVAEDLPRLEAEEGLLTQ
jgi:integrase